MSFLQLILQFLPAILQIVMAIEAAFKASVVPVPGAAKKAIAIDVLTTGSLLAGQPLAAEHLAGVGSIIDAVVASLNKTGVFTSQTKAAV